MKGLKMCLWYYLLSTLREISSKRESSLDISALISSLNLFNSLASISTISCLTPDWSDGSVGDTMPATPSVWHKEMGGVDRWADK